MALNSSEGRKPAFFEMYAQERLVPMLRPAIKHVIAVLAERNVRLLPLHNYADATITAWLVVLEGYFLRKHGSTFAENFYGLQRSSEFGQPGGKLTLLQQLSTVFVVVLLPAFRERAEEHHNRQAESATSWRQDSQDTTAVAAESDTSIRARLTRFWRVLTKGYPVFHAVLEAVTFVYRLRYMFDYGSHFSPFLHLQGLVVQRMSMQDIMQQSRESLRDQLQRKIRNNEMGIMMRLLQTGQNVAQLGLDSVKYMLLASVFGFRFLDWWYSSDTTSAVRPKIIVVPPPVSPPVIHEHGIQLPDNRALCGLCNQQRTNSAVTPTGFAFCYPCVFAYVEENRRCPVTHCPMQQSAIRRIYEAQ